MIDRRPAAIARCISADDVRAAVLFGAETGIPLAVRGGGHSISGASSCDAGLVIDLSAMTRVDVDPVARTARADPGCCSAPLISLLRRMAWPPPWV